MLSLLSVRLGAVFTAFSSNEFKFFQNLVAMQIRYYKSLKSNLTNKTPVTICTSDKGYAHQGLQK